ncbi:MAG: zinc-ribbon domain-containing protein [Oscillospiraceae bacterium]|nr:zinc-ribbon domain-containing protein [Oscillospiraceae bacterium]MDD4510650.1 zinc-ribbon domain-containing protein [Oscillospiraceae bacterium]
MSKRKKLSENAVLMQQWDFEKNVRGPECFTEYSHVKVWWKCTQGHSWEAMIFNRTYGDCCPYCVGKKVIPGINDLQTLNPALASEWDLEKNALHPSQVAVKSNKKAWWKCAAGHSWEARIFSRNEGISCPYCSGQKIITGTNDLQTLNPQLAEEWDHCKNTCLPSQVGIKSNKRVWWRCSQGHSWRAAIFNRTAGRHCPYCAGQKVLIGFNDLETLYPQIADEWDWDKNRILPTTVTPGSNRRVWWKCSVGHSWRSEVAGRVGGRGCPYCVGKVQYKPKCVR